MRENSKVSVAKRYILGKFEKNKSCKDKKFLCDNPTSNSGTYYSALQILRVEKADDPKFIDWVENIRDGPKIEPLADQVKRYFEECLAKDVTPQRGAFLQEHPKVTVKNYGKILVRWVEAKRKENDPNFAYWDKNIRRRRISHHVDKSKPESEENSASEDEDEESPASIVEDQTKEQDLQEQDSDRTIEIPIENSPREIKITKKSQRKKITSKRVNQVQNVQTKLFPANSKSSTINNLDSTSSENVPTSSPPQNVIKDRWGAKKAKAANYIRSRFKKGKPATFTRFQKKHLKISSGVYYGALREVKLEYQADNRFTEWLNLCKAANKQEKKAFPKHGQVAIDEVVNFIETQLKSGGLIDFQTYISLHPKRKQPIYKLGLLKFQVLNQNNSDLYSLFSEQVPHSESKLNRFKNFLSQTYAKNEKIDWTKFFDQNNDISPLSIRKFKRSWLEDQTNNYEAAEEWLKRNQTVDRACVIGQLFERAIISILFAQFQKLGITLYYQTRNFIETKTGICVEGRIFVRDLNHIKEKFGPTLQKFLKSCDREEIAVDLTISPDIAYKYRKYADFLTALLVVIAEKLPNHQPLENHIHSLKLEDFIGPDWFNFDSEVTKIIKEIVKDQQEALIQGRKSPAFQRLKTLAREKWKEVRHLIKENATRRHYLKTVIDSIFNMVISGNASHQLQVYLQGLRQRGHIAAADYLEGVARDRARRKGEESSNNQGGEGGSQNHQEGVGNEKQPIPERTAVTQPGASITPENDAGQQDREEARSGSTDTPAKTWARCNAMFPDRRHRRQQQVLEEELAWESYDRQVAAAGTGENLPQRGLTGGGLTLSTAPVATHTVEPATIHESEIATQSDPAVSDSPEGGQGVPTPEDMSVSPPVADEGNQDSDNAEPEGETEAGAEKEGTTGQESDEPPTEEPNEESEEAAQTSEKTPQPAIEVTSDGGTLVLESSDPSDPKAPDGGENRAGGEDKGGENGNGEAPHRDLSTPEGGESKSKPQRGDNTATAIAGDRPVQVTGSDLQSIRNSAAYGDGALVIGKDGKGVLLSPKDSKDITGALDHVQHSINNAREDVCGPDPNTKVNPEGRDITGQGQQTMPIKGDDLLAIRDASKRGGEVIIAGEKGNLHLNAKDTKDIKGALDHVQQSLNNARKDVCGPDPAPKAQPDGRDITGDGKRGIPITKDDLHTIQDAGKRGDGVMIVSDRGSLHLDGKDTAQIRAALDHARDEIAAARPADARKIADNSDVNGSNFKTANPKEDAYPIHAPQEAQGKGFSRETAERINNALDRLGMALNRLEWKLANSDRGDRLSSRMPVNPPPRERGQDYGREKSYDNPRYPATPDAKQQSAAPLPDKSPTTNQPPAGERPQDLGDHSGVANNSKDHEQNPIPFPDTSREVEKPAARERGKVSVGPAEGDLCGYITRKDGRLGVEGQKTNLEPFEWQTDPPRAPSDRGREPPAPKQPPDKPAPGGDGPRREEPNGDETNLPKPDPTPDNQGQDNSSGTLPKDEEDEAPEGTHDPDPYVPEEEEEDEWAGWNPESGQESGADNSEGGEDQDQAIPEEDDDDEWAGWNPESGHETGDEGKDHGKDHVDDGKGAENRGENQNDECIDRGERGSFL